MNPRKITDDHRSLFSDTLLSLHPEVTCEVVSYRGIQKPPQITACGKVWGTPPPKIQPRIMAWSVLIWVGRSRHKAQHHSNIHRWPDDPRCDFWATTSVAIWHMPQDGRSIQPYVCLRVWVLYTTVAYFNNDNDNWIDYSVISTQDYVNNVHGSTGFVVM